MFFISFFVFIFGLCVGSFLNVVVLRLKKGENFVAGRSFCPKCHKEIAWFDNIPLVSFFLLLGRCRRCQQKISWQYPLVEFFTGILFLVAFIFVWQEHLLLFYFAIELLYYFIIIAFLIIIFVYDFKYYLILDKVVIPAVVVVFLYQGIIFLIKNNFFYSIFSQESRIYYSALIFSAIIIAGFFLLQFLISRGRWIGGGDIRLGFLMGLILGWPKAVLALFLAYILGSLFALPLLISGNKKMSSQIPFGTFLVVATLICLFLGQQILDWYLNFIYV